MTLITNTAPSIRKKKKNYMETRRNRSVSWTLCTRSLEGGIIASSISNELPDTLPSPFSDKPAKNQPRFRVTRIKRNFITDTARAQLLQLPCRRYAYEVFIPWFRSRSNSISIAIHRSLSPAFFALIEITDERRNVEM